MIEVYVCVGVFDSYDEMMKNGGLVKYSLPQMPSIGDIIIPTGELASLVERKKKEWKTESYITYVKSIAYYGSSIIVMLGGNPRMISVDFFFDGKCAGSYLAEIPRIGDLVYVEYFDRDNGLYVESVLHSQGSSVVSVFLSRKQVLPMVDIPNRVDVYVENNCLDVNVNNTVEVDASRGELDVRLTGQTRTIEVRSYNY